MIDWPFLFSKLVSRLHVLPVAFKFFPFSLRPVFISAAATFPYSFFLVVLKSVLGRLMSLFRHFEGWSCWSFETFSLSLPFTISISTGLSFPCCLIRSLFPWQITSLHTAFRLPTFRSFFSIAISVIRWNLQLPFSIFNTRICSSSFWILFSWIGTCLETKLSWSLNHHYGCERLTIIRLLEINKQIIHKIWQDIIDTIHCCCSCSTINTVSITGTK